MDVTSESVALLLASADYGDRLRGLNQLRTLDAAIAFPMVCQAVGDPNARVRYLAVSQLSGLGHEDLSLALDLLLERLQTDKEIDVRAAAADSLGALGLSQAYPELAALYRSNSDWLLQVSIVAALGELGAPEAVELLQEALGSPVELVQTAAIAALGELGDRQAVPWLIPLVEHSDWQVRYRVAQALHRLGGDDVAAPLAQLATDPETSVAQAARGE